MVRIHPNLINFVSLLGWHGSDNKEIYHIDELIQHFSIKRIRSSCAVFDTKTLLWFNQEYIKNMDSEILLLNDQIKLYDDRLKIADRWYNKRWFGIVVGVVGTSGVIYLAGQVQ